MILIFRWVIYTVSKMVKWLQLTGEVGKSINVDVKKVKGKGFPYSIPSVGPGADPGDCTGSQLEGDRKSSTRR